MTESPSMPPAPESGNRSFLVAALVMLGLIGVLLVWKSLRSDPPPPAPPPVQKPPPVARPLDEAPPPPPEIVALPSPEPVPEPVKPPVKRVSVCDGECVGQETPELVSALRAKGGQARSCYERALKTNSSLTGHMTVNIRVGPGGEACSASIGSDALNDSSVSNCVLSRFRSGRFPKPQNGCVDVVVPLNFVPKQP